MRRWRGLPNSNAMLWAIRHTAGLYHVADTKQVTHIADVAYRKP